MSTYDVPTADDLSEQRREIRKNFAVATFRRMFWSGVAVVNDAMPLGTDYFVSPGMEAWDEFETNAGAFCHAFQLAQLSRCFEPTDIAYLARFADLARECFALAVEANVYNTGPKIPASESIFPELNRIQHAETVEVQPCMFGFQVPRPVMERLFKIINDFAQSGSWCVVRWHKWE